MKAQMIREGETLFLVVDGDRVLHRDDSDGQWLPASPGDRLWQVGQTQFMGPDGKRFDGLLFTFEGKAIDQVFRLDEEGNPHSIPIADVKL